ALNPHHRNLKDDQIKAIAGRRGVIGANYYAGFLSAQVNDEMEAMRKSEEYKKIQEEFKDDRRGRAAAMQKLYQKVLSPVPLSVLIDHIDYIVKLVGPDYVGLGSDFDGISAAPRGLEDISKVPAITAALLERGYSDEDIKKILGANWLRVFREVLGE
ncbi:MAG: membrane dipeptidase, partial [Candidatus Tectomicrobia bacterium]|nr:membrane dipeptidase [Candidatus Tectomicrobia bacterium]